MLSVEDALTEIESVNAKVENAEMEGKIPPVRSRENNSLKPDFVRWPLGAKCLIYNGTKPHGL